MGGETSTFLTSHLGLSDNQCRDVSSGGLTLDSLNDLGALIAHVRTLKLPEKREPTSQQKAAAEYLGMFHWNMLKLPFGIDPQILKGLLDNGSFDVTFPQGFKVGTNTTIRGITFENGVMTDIDGTTSDFLGHLGYILDGNTERELTSAEAFILGLPTRANLLSTMPLPRADIHFASLGEDNLVVPSLEIPGIARVENMVVTGGTDIITTGSNSFDVKTFTLKVTDSTVGRLTLFPDKFTNGENVITNSGAKNLEVTFERGSDGLYFIKHAELVLVAGDASLAGGDVTSGNAELTIKIDGTENGVLTINVEMPKASPNSITATACLGEGVGVPFGITNAGADDVDATVTVDTKNYSPDLSSWSAKYDVSSTPKVERLNLFGDVVTLTDFSCDSSDVGGEWLPGVGAQSLESDGCTGTLTLNLFGQTLVTDLGDQRLELDLTPDITNPKLYAATLSAPVENMAIETDAGTLTISGELAGSMLLVNIGDGEVPDLRLVAGSLDLSHSGTTLVDGPAGKVTGSTSLKITDDATGLVTIANITKSAVPMVGAVNLDTGVTVSGAAIAYAGQTPYYALTPGKYVIDSDVSGSAGMVSGIRGGAHATVDLTQSGIVDFDAALKPASFTVNAKSGKTSVNVTGGSTVGKINYNDTSLASTIKIEPPQSIHIVQEIKQGKDELLVDMELTPVGAIQASLTPATKNLELSTAPNAGLTGLATIKRKNPETGSFEAAGTVKITSPYSVTGKMQGNDILVTFAMPNTEISGELTNDIVLSSGVLPAGARFSLPIKGFKGDITLIPGEMAVKSRWRAADFGPAVIDVPPAILAAAFPDLKDNLHVEITGLANGQEYDLNASLEGGIDFSGVAGSGGLKPTDVSVTVSAGDAIKLAASSSSSLGAVSARYDLATGRLRVSLDGIALAASVTKSLINLPGKPIALENVVLENLVKSLDVTVDANSGALSVNVIPYAGQEFTPPPTDAREWLAWMEDPQKLAAYQAQLANPSWKHLAKVSGIESVLSLLPPNIPRGRGTLYVDLAKPINFSLNLNDLQNPDALAAKMAELNEAVFAALSFHWSEPTAPQAEEGAEPLMYSAKMDALYVVDRTDTKLPELLAAALGIPEDEAAELFANGRVDFALFANDPVLASIFTEESLRAFMGFYLEGKSGENFTRSMHRFLMAVGDIRRDHQAMQKTHPMAWNDKVRAVSVRAFPEPGYQGMGAEAADDAFDGFNGTYAVYFPGTTPTQVYALWSDVAGWKKWRPQLSGTRAVGDHFEGRFAGRKFAITTQGQDYGDHAEFNYVNNPDIEDGFDVFSGTSLILPTRDGGTMVIDQVAVNATNEYKDKKDKDGNVTRVASFDDKKLYKRKHQELKTPKPEPTAEEIAQLQELKEKDPKAYRKQKSKAMMDKVMAFVGNLISPKSDPTEVHPIVQNQTYSSAAYELGIDGKSGNLLAKSGIRSTLRTHPGETQVTANITEFAFLEDPEKSSSDSAAIAAKEKAGEKEAAAVDGEKPAPVIFIRTDGANKSRATQLLQYVGFSAAQISEIMTTGKLDLAVMAALPSVAKHFDAETLYGLARAVLEDNPYFRDELWRGLSDRFFLIVGDIIKHYEALTGSTRTLVARSFSSAFHGKSPTNKTFTDTVDSITYFAYPASADYEKVVDAFAKPWEFPKYSKDYNASGCSEKDYVDESGEPTPYKLIDWDIAVIGKCQLLAPKDVCRYGPVASTPWTAYGTMGFEENEGTWYFFKLVTGEVMAVRHGLLNASTPGDKNPAFAKIGLGGVTRLLSGIGDTVGASGMNTDVAMLPESSVAKVVTG